MKKEYFVILNLFVLFLGWSCSNKALVYNPDQKRSVYFCKDAGRYALGMMPDTVLFSFAAFEESEYQYDIPVKFIGMPVKEDLECEVEVITDSTTAESGKHFEIKKLIFSKGKVEGTLSIMLKRTEDIMNHPVIIYLKLKENDDFIPMENEYFRLSVVDGVLVAPIWWTTYYLGEYANGNHKLYQKILENYWKLEELKPVFYTETVKEYGKYLEKAPAAFFQQSGNMVWIKYVFKPAYEFYSDPANTYEGFDMIDPDSYIR